MASNVEIVKELNFKFSTPKQEYSRQLTKKLDKFDLSSESGTTSSESEFENGCEKCQFEMKFSNLEVKIDTIFSLASTLNSQNLEQNSQILYNMSESNLNFDSIQNSNCLQLVIKIVYDEWNEFFEFFHLYKQNKLEENMFSLFKNKRNFIQILQRRLLSRKLGNQTMFNLIISNSKTEEDTASLGINLQNRKDLKIYELIRSINEYSTNFYEFLITKIDGQILNFIELNPVVLNDSKSLFSLFKLTNLKENLNEIAKRSFDEEQRLISISLGGAPALCEIYSIIFNFIDYFKNKSAIINKELDELLHKISLNILIILNNLTTNNKLNDQLCLKRYWLSTIYFSLGKSLISAIANQKKDDSVQPNDLIKLHACLIRNLSSTNSQNNKTDISSVTLQEINFSKLLTKCALFYSRKISKENNSTLKIILQAMLNLSALSMKNKENICNVNGSLQMLLNFLSKRNDTKVQSLSSFEELASSLLRSLSIFCSKNQKLRQFLRDNNLYSILLDNSLYSSNLNIVANACGILWSMSAKSYEEQIHLRELEADSRLTHLTHSTNKLISIISMAILKNILKPKLKKRSNSINDSSQDSLTESNTSERSLSEIDHSVSSDSSSSFCFYSNLPILASRNRKQSQENFGELSKILEKSIPDQNVLNDLCNLSELSMEFESLDDESFESSYSSICSSSLDSFSSESLSLSSNSSESSLSSQSYDLESRIKTTPRKSRKLKKTINNHSKSPGKHVTFSGKKTYLFEKYSHENLTVETLSNDEESNVSIEIIDLDDTQHDINDSFDTSGNDSRGFESPEIPDLRFIKPNSSLHFKTSNSSTSISNDCTTSNSNSPDANLSSLSLLLEPAKQLISKIDAHLNSDTSDNSNNTIQEISNSESVKPKTKSCLKQTKQPATTRTSQMRQTLSQKNKNRTRSAPVAPKPQIPKRTTSLGPFKNQDPKIVNPSGCQSKIQTSPSIRTNSFIIMDRINNRKRNFDGGEIYQV